jgi:hypothetical protein
MQNSSWRHAKGWERSGLKRWYLHHHNHPKDKDRNREKEKENEEKSGIDQIFINVE